MSSGIYYIIAVLVGMIAGAIGAVFHMSVDKLTTTWPVFLQDSLQLSGAPLYISAALIAAIMAVCSLWLIRRFAPEAGGSGVQEIEGAMEGVRTLRWYRVLPVKFFGGLLSLGSGMVLGREGPTIHMGAAVAKAASDIMRWPDKDMRAMLAAGGAAGLAAAFNAPLAALLFIIEETRKQFPYSPRSYIAVALAAISSAIVTQYLTGKVPYMELAVPAMPYITYPAFIVLGLLLGVLGVAFNRSLVWSLDSVRQLGIRTSFYIFPLCIGLVIGVLMFARPEATLGGELLAVHLAKASLPLGVLAIIALLRFIMTLTSYSTGVAGGIFAPILALAASVGLCFAAVLSLFISLPDSVHVALAISAMGGLFAATIGAPMVGMVLVIELTGAYEILIPIMLTTIFANMAAQWLGGRPIYEVLLERTLAIEAEEQKPSN
ncbi:H(+)/Cl(-) exchange transporter ClcA [Pseudochelatococcus sp. G4_1912]|uniref:H(+)/Cl(-) exchange transporter ClcA n=1 Tax=Pseudochelatococcus sp. G4_1912 TaxID=3114288 RepID=UPI0039C61168